MDISVLPRNDRDNEILVDGDIVALVTVHSVGVSFYGVGDFAFYTDPADIDWDQCSLTSAVSFVRDSAELNERLEREDDEAREAAEEPVPSYDECAADGGRASAEAVARYEEMI